MKIALLFVPGFVSLALTFSRLISAAIRVEAASIAPKTSFFIFFLYGKLIMVFRLYI